MKIGDTVSTNDGQTGIIVNSEFSGKIKRFGVDIDNNKYGFNPVYYFADELIKEQKC